MKTYHPFLWTVSAVACLPSNLLACSVCMGANGGTLADASNGAIFVMLGVLGFVFSLVSLAGYSIVKRGTRPLPPHAELGNVVSEPSIN